MIDKFIGYIANVRRYSMRTQLIYRRVLEEFSEFSRLGNDFSRISPAAVRDYEVHLLDERALSPRSVNLHVSVLSSFCGFLVREGILEANPVRLVSRPKTEKRLPAFYRQESMEDYFNATQCYVDEPDMGLPERYRRRLARLITATLYGTGIRRSELIGLKMSSLDLKRRVLRVKGKGDKIREIPIIASLYEEILLYLQSVDSMVGCGRTADSPLLVTEKGTGLYPVYVDRAIKEELGGVNGITGRKSPHVLRHTLATELLDEGADLNSIKELLGHSSLAATQVYTHNSVEKLKSVYNNAHPRAKSGGNYGDQD